MERDVELNDCLHKHWLRDPFYYSLSPEERQLFLEDYKDTLRGHVFITGYYTKEVLKDISRALGENMGKGDRANEKRYSDVCIQDVKRRYINTQTKEEKSNGEDVEECKSGFLQ